MYLVWASSWVLFRWASRRECSATEKCVISPISSFTISISSCTLFFICNIWTALWSRDTSLSTAPPPCVLNSIPSQSAAYRSFNWIDWGSVYKVPSNESLQYGVEFSHGLFQRLSCGCYLLCKSYSYPLTICNWDNERNKKNIAVSVDRYEANKDHQVFKVCVLTFFPLLVEKLVEGACATVHSLRAYTCVHELLHLWKGKLALIASACGMWSRESVLWNCREGH